ncbi:polyprenyl synthetase [Teladorsagia circumcincta]|uniref:Farnesyl pyrophosphate synthase n=1 Tax=Teladorsagia circumcincta TaxID=45464 RepID=A0A2G9UMT4_TELCI|nr:polyprenyl synthetase [Teladorsagia circumcincta]
MICFGGFFAEEGPAAGGLAAAIQAVKQGSSRSLIEVALKNVRKRFLDQVTRRFAPDSSEYDTVKYRMKKLYDSTVVGGKNARSTLALDSFRALNPDASEVEVHTMAECASLLELIQSFYLILDDIMDGAETRRGNRCWYKRPDIGLGAINDALLLDAFIEEIIRDLYAAHPQVDRLCSSYQKSKQMTLLGQLMDVSSAREIDAFTWDRYEQLVEMKTSHYSFFHPIEMAMLDDLLDVFGDPAMTGKIGTDIQDGKCTWISVRAAQKLRGKPEMSLFKEHYGKPAPKSVANIKELFEKLKIQDEFLKFQRNFSEKSGSPIISSGDEETEFGRVPTLLEQPPNITLA